MLFSSPYKKLIFTFLATLPVFVGLLCLLVHFHKPLSVFPRQENDIPAYPYADEVEGGNSTVEAFEKGEDKLVFNYTLREGIIYPFAGIHMAMPFNGTYLNVSAYDFFDLELVTQNKTSIKVLLRFHIDNYSQPDDFWSYGLLERELLIEPQHQHYRLPLSSFKLPAWWYDKLSRPLPVQVKPDLRQLFSIHLDASIITHLGRPESLTISRLSFQKPAAFLYTAAGLLCLLYAGGFSLWFVRLKSIYSTTKNELMRGYRPTDLANYKDEELGRIIDFIKTHYSDPDISVNTLYTKTGINLRKINQLIKEHKLGSFKQLLNTLRIEEAKRLLQATDRQILEIALAVGFSNAVHFNRVFREQTGMTPKEYRSKPKTKV